MQTWIRQVGKKYAALLCPNNCEVSIHKIFLLTYLG